MALLGMSHIGESVVEGGEKASLKLDGIEVGEKHNSLSGVV